MIYKEMSATKEFTWDMAHVLSGHEGLCKNLHGHTYKMLVTAVRTREGEVIPAGPSKGMVLDFKDLKNTVKRLIVDPLDHATMIDTTTDDAFELALYDLLTTHHKKTYPVKYRPTAENMAMHFMHLINYHLEGSDAGYIVTKLRLYETPTSYADVAI